MSHLQVLGASHASSRVRDRALDPEEQTRHASRSEGCERIRQENFIRVVVPATPAKTGPEEADHPLQQVSSEESSKGIGRRRREVASG